MSFVYGYSSSLSIIHFNYSKHWFNLLCMEKRFATDDLSSPSKKENYKT